jgi:mannose-1-phosphate guanylyltransferase
MFQHPLDRTDRFTVPEHKVTLIGRTHQREARAQFTPREAGKLIVQPANRDTAAGIYLALTYVRAQDPQAMVVLYPSDHFVYPADRFLEVVRSALLEKNNA